MKLLQGFVVALALLAATAASASFLGMDASKWQIRFSKNMPAHPTQIAGDGFYFDWPKKGSGQIDYLTRPYGKLLPQGGNLAVTVEIQASADASWNYKMESSNICVSPARITLILQKKGDNLWAANGRFYSNMNIKNAAGSFTLVVPLTYSNWHNVNGQQSQSGFNKILKNMGNIGVVFGGGCFDGHGQNMESGSAKFIMKSYEIR